MITENSGSQISVIIPTYNESKNIVGILDSIAKNIPYNSKIQTIVVDDNSPDGTAEIVENYIQTIKKIANYTIDIIRRKKKLGLSSAILNGIQYAKGETIIVMDGDLSHPPQIIPKMIEKLRSHYDIVIASRYVQGGIIKNWSWKRKFLSKSATMMAKKSLGIRPDDPMSGFFAFKKKILSGISFDALGYKILLEILVKTKNVKVIEIPYTFTDRQFGKSKMTLSVLIDFCRSVLKLYRYGKTISKQEKRSSVKFVSKAARFYTVGASGLLVNYVISILFSSETMDLWYLHANIFGIIGSIFSNFILNKIWTFEDIDFSLGKTLSQLSKFAIISILGAGLQLGTIFYLVEEHQLLYPLALVIAVLGAAVGNFILNKKLTFKEKLWG